ncbi:MAG TPA: cell division protein FtsQ/DivIB [Solirubrobacteraceae bacterium]|nr:cell division protein FtsQ/DivIB [Solirubrobacteraceae bacterium]
MIARRKRRTGSTQGRARPIARRLAGAATGTLLGRRVIAVLLVGVLPLSAGYWFWLRDSSLFAVKRADVVGAAGANAHRIRSALAAAARHMTTLHVDAAALRRAVRGFPEVRGLHTSTDPPHRLKIVVALRLPVAALTVNGQRLPVAGDGTILRGEQAGAYLPRVALEALPKGKHLHSPRALEQVGLLAAAPPALRRRVTRIVHGRDGIRLTLRNGPAVIFGDDARLEAKWTAAGRVLADHGSIGARYVDVRIPDRAVAGGLGAALDPIAPNGQNRLPGTVTGPGQGPGTGPPRPAGGGAPPVTSKPSSPSPGPRSQAPARR